MFRQTRFQTGELTDITAEMEKGRIPCMDVDNNEEFEWFVKLLARHGFFRVENMPYDRTARDRVREPEFEFRVPFCRYPARAENIKIDELMYIDVYFEPDIDETYDSIGEI